MKTPIDVANWFIFRNPELATHHQNRKLDKLVYFSDLMHTAVYGFPFVGEPRVGYEHGPVHESIHKAYSKGHLIRIPDKKDLADFSSQEERVMQVVDIAYGDCDHLSLEEEARRHPSFQKISPNIDIDEGIHPVVDIEEEESVMEMLRRMYRAYEGFDFNRLEKVRINGNVFYYLKDNLEMSEELLEELSHWSNSPEAIFLEDIDGELVIS